MTDIDRVHVFDWARAAVGSWCAGAGGATLRITSSPLGKSVDNLGVYRMTAVSRSVAVCAVGFLFAVGVSTGASAAVTPDVDELAGIDARTLDEQYRIGPESGASSDGEFSLAASSKSAQGGSTISTLGVLLTYSPAQCKGETDDPHPAQYQSIPGYIGTDSVSVHGRTTCKHVVQQATVQTTIKRERWYGLETVMTSPVQKKSNNVWSGEATPHWMCAGEGTYTYRGYSTDTSTEGGKVYTAKSSAYGDPISRFFC